jgi:alanyl-tRNA synthetase
MEEAMDKGAMALFGEKYGNSVRVVKFDHSVELCGGTHVKATGQIGQLIIKQETSIAAGIRRIEAITALAAEEYLYDQRQSMDQIRDLFKSPIDVVKAAEQLLNQNKDLQKKIEQLNEIALQQQKQEILNKFKEVKGVNLLASQENMDADSLKKLTQQLIAENKNCLVILTANIEGKPIICVGVSKDLIEAKGLHAGNIIRELVKEIQGGGGGQPHLAVAGGKNTAGLAKVLDRAPEFIQ